MAYAKHIIKKQVIALEIEESLNSTDIQNRVSRLYRDTVVPLLDKLFSDKSAASPLVIDHLEIDIGVIPEDKLEVMLAEKIKTALQQNLAATKPSSSGNSRVEESYNKKQAQSDHSDEALVIYFLQTGLFPWWAQENNYSFLEQKLLAVIKQNNLAFKNSFRNFLQDAEIVKRLAYNFNDALHETIAKQFLNISVLTIQPEKEMLFSLFTDWYNLRELQAFWRMSFYKAIIAPGIHAEKKLFEKTAELFIVSVLHKSNIVSALTSPSPGKQQKEFSEKINRLDNKFLKEAFKNYLQTIIVNDEYPLKQIKTDNILSEQINDESSAEKKHVASGADPDEVNLKNKESINKLSAEKKHAIRGADTDKMNLQNKESINKISTEKKHVIPVADLDKIYVQNAGLILLHPFFSRFFQNLGLLNEKNFNDETAAERACFILQYLVTGDVEDMFEAQLPLNKILCGIPLLQPVDTQLTITEIEKEIAEHFLFSVVQNGGTGWKNLSVEGLRKAYLNREGIISARDGNWLLQVKRETYDILIDRLPWTIQIVKMPWMERLMFVEWQVL